MNKLLNSINHPKYMSEELLGKYIYFSKKYSDSQVHYIFNIKSMDVSGGISKIIYKCDKAYMFMIPEDKNRKAFLYDNYKEITVNGLVDILYEMTFSEYVNTFREFFKNDEKYVYEIPNKIIQDI